MRHPFTFFKPYLIIIFKRVSSDCRKEKNQIHNVCKCRLLFDLPVYLIFVRVSRVWNRDSFSGRFPISAFHGWIGWNCISPRLLACFLACLNRWNSAGVRFRFSGKYWDYHFLWSKTCTSFWQFEFQKTAQFVAQCSLFKAYSVENPAVRSNFPTTSSKTPDEGMNQFENHSYQERWG